MCLSFDDHYECDFIAISKLCYIARKFDIYTNLQLYKNYIYIILN